MLTGEKGFASIEIVPILTIFVLLFNFTLGFFGVIHSGILNSIAARNYAFETFRNRTSLNYLRDDPDAAWSPGGGGGGTISADDRGTYLRVGYRFHSVVGEDMNPSVTNFVATKRFIKFTDLQSAGEVLGSAEEHRTNIRQIASDQKASLVFTGHTKAEGRAGVNPVWVRTSYGICLTYDCQTTKFSLQ